MAAPRLPPEARPAVTGAAGSDGSWVGVGYLRACLTVLVVAHHSVLAYFSGAPAPSDSLLTEPRWWRAFPVVDPHRWSGFSLFIGFNDSFFMALMFLLSGLFVWRSLERKGTGRFLRGRLRRLGIPFAVSAALLAPLSYFPSYLQTGMGGGLGAFWRAWLAQSSWPVGPAWFLWLLLAFDGAVAALVALRPDWWAARVRGLSGSGPKPGRLFAVLAGVTTAAYVPAALYFHEFHWTVWGPFEFQTCRLLLYFIYFVAGVGIGAAGKGEGALAPEGALARGWPGWLGASFLSTGARIALAMVGDHRPGAAAGWRTLEDLSFGLASAATSLCFLAVFVRFVRTRVGILDRLQGNAYGIYLLHYGVVVWLQFALLGSPLPAPAKGALVFAGALALSWGAASLLRRLPSVARLI